MLQTASNQQTAQWIAACSLEQIIPNTGVCALLKGKQIAIFRIGNTEETYAICNYDPFSKTYVLSRGIIGDRNGVPKVASPIYKQNFSLITGQCLDNEAVSVRAFPTKVVDGQVMVNVA